MHDVVTRRPCFSGRIVYACRAFDILPTQRSDSLPIPQSESFRINSPDSLAIDIFPNGVRFLFVYLFFGFAYPLVALGRSVEIFGTRVPRDVYLSQFSFPCMYTIFSFLFFSLNLDM